MAFRPFCPLVMAFAAAVLASCSRASAREVVAPDGTKGWAVTCKAEQGNCFEKAGELCPSGYSVFDRSGRTAGVVAYGNENFAVAQAIYKGELLISCRTDSVDEVDQGNEPSPRAVSSPRADPPSKAEAKQAAPVGAAGFQFGASAADLEAVCAAADEQWKAAGAEATCSGAASNVGFAPVVELRFCEGTACVVTLSAAATAATWKDRLKFLRERLVENYGEPSKRRTSVPADCKDDIYECLSDRTAHVSFEWTWPDGHFVHLSVGAAPEERPRIRVVYANPSGARALRAKGL